MVGLGLLPASTHRSQVKGHASQSNTPRRSPAAPRGTGRTCAEIAAAREAATAIRRIVISLLELVLHLGHVRAQVSDGELRQASIDRHPPFPSFGYRPRSSSNRMLPILELRHASVAIAVHIDPERRSSRSGVQMVAVAVERPGRVPRPCTGNLVTTLQGDSLSIAHAVRAELPERKARPCRWSAEEWCHSRDVALARKLLLRRLVRRKLKVPLAPLPLDDEVVKGSRRPRVSPHQRMAELVTAPPMPLVTREAAAECAAAGLPEPGGPGGGRGRIYAVTLLPAVEQRRRQVRDLGRDCSSSTAAPFFLCSWGSRRRRGQRGSQMLPCEALAAASASPRDAARNRQWR